MKVLVVYDSFFGNTEKIANAICGALEGQDVSVVRVNALTEDALKDVDLLLVGSPTRAFQPSPATKAWLNTIPAGALAGKKVASFDTRINPKDAGSAFLAFMVKIFGYAADPIGKALTKKGGALTGTPEGFFVKESEGPLKDGELERAAAWAKALVK